MATLEVLCFNGRWEKVKVSQGTPLLEVVDEVCTKQGLDPTKHRLVHSGKNIDSSQQFRYSGLLNNAKLTLVEADCTDNANSEVSVALQLPSGQRHVATFTVGKTLFEVLSHFESISGQGLTSHGADSASELYPCCIYAQTEVIGTVALQATQLRNLGLTGGRAVLRFLWKELKPEQLEEINKEIAARQAKARRLEERRIATLTAATSSDQMDTGYAHPVHEETPSAQSGETVRLRSVFDDSPAVSAFGNGNRERSMFDPPPQAPRPPPAPVESMFLSKDEPPAPLGQFVGFKFPEETKGKDLYQNELSAANVADLTKPCDREAVLYKTSEAKELLEQDRELPDDFYEVTKEDLQLMHQDLMRQANFSVPSSAALRYEKYERAVIRVHFPSDGLVLQAVFRPTEPVFSLHKFVVQQLQGHPNTTTNSFYLYTPPRRILAETVMGDTFASAGLLPAANVYITGRNTTSVHVSAAAQTSLLGSFEKARSVVNKWVTAAVNAGISEIRSYESSSTGGQSSPTEGASIRPPKWFKPR